ncbi:MAG: DsbA family protein [Candidatus Uhrbacteria bacterium]|nr:DsbA family protein [Candidatus Uhrbacteria bacterium]
MKDDAQVHQKRGWTGTIITLVILFLLGAFVWRVVFFTAQIRNGGLNLSDLNFSKTVSTMTKLASEPVKEGGLDVAINNRPTLGTKSAPITIVEFADFGCPFSRTSSVIIRTLAAKYPNQFSFIYRDFPLPELHLFAQKASEAAACAEEQGKFWEYHDKLYQNQNTLGDDSFEQFANQLNMDTARFHDCYAGHTYAKQIEQDYQDGLAAGVRGTPTFFINGTRVPGSIPQNILENVIQSVNAQKN